MAMPNRIREGERLLSLCTTKAPIIASVIIALVMDRCCFMATLHCSTLLGALLTRHILRDSLWVPLNSCALHIYPLPCQCRHSLTGVFITQVDRVLGCRVRMGAPNSLKFN
jgi:hypothetical protein